MRDTGLQFVFPVLSVWPGGRGEARLLVFSMGWNFRMGAGQAVKTNHVIEGWGLVPVISVSP